MLLKLTARLIASAVLLALPSGIASVSAQDLCMKNVGGLGGVPILDGIVTGDPGWNNAVQVNLSGDLGATTASKMLLGRANFAGQNALYIGLVVDAPVINTDTTVVLGFSPSASAADDWRIHIGLKSGLGGTPQVTFWRDSTPGTGWNNPGATAFPTAAGQWQFDNMKFTENGPHWEMEFVVPIVAVAGPGGICLGCAGATSFKMYTNVLNTFLGGSSSAVGQDVWPPCNMGVACPSNLTAGPITQTTPANTNWGTVWLSGAPANACTGVSLAWSDIGIEDPPNSGTIVQQIKRLGNAIVTEATLAQCTALADNFDPGNIGAANTFIAKPFNSMATPAKVSVTYRLANWGVPGAGQFSPIGSPVPAGCTATTCAGVSSNPTVEAVVPATSSATFNSTKWALNHKQSCFYKFQVHQCIQVEMDSSDPNTRFLNRSAQKNMNFVPASTIQQTATISGDQGELPRGQKAHRFLLAVSEERQGPPLAGATPRPDCNCSTGDHRFLRDQQLAGAAQRAFGGRADHLLAWIVRSHVYTGDKIIINKRPYDSVRRAGDFGIVAGHRGPITGWTSRFTGKTLRPFSATGQRTTGLYTLEVAPKQAATVDAVIVAAEAKTPTLPPVKRAPPAKRAR